MYIIVIPIKGVIKLPLFNKDNDSINIKIDINTQIIDINSFILLYLLNIHPQIYLMFYLISIL